MIRWAGRCGLAMVFLSSSIWIMDRGYAGDEAPATKWQHLVSVSVSGGYRDNVLLSADLPQASPFLGVGLDLIAWRPLGDRGEFQGLVVGDHRQFFDVDSADQEQILLAQARYEHDLGAEWKLLMPVNYLYLDQVLDVSATEVQVQTARVQGHAASLSPSLQRQLSLGTLELELTGLRQFYASPLDDSWELGSRLGWQYPFSGGNRVEAYYDFTQVWYDNDPQLTADGDPIPGTQRRMQLHEVGAKLRHEWGERRVWRATLGLSGRYATDQASHYYDYLRPAATAQLVYRDKGWRLEGTVRGRHYAYQEQRGASQDESRRRSELALEFRGEREILSWLQLIAEYTYEQTFANRPAEAYTVNTVSCGLEILF